MKTSRQLERYFKGAANHRRLDILKVVHKNKKMTLFDIAEKLGCNFKTISGHTDKLVRAGLLDKSHFGRSVVHALSPYGERFIAFMKKF